MMLIVAAIIGLCGFVFSIIWAELGYKNSIFLPGIIVSSASIVLTFLIFKNTPVTTNGYVFLALFIVIPSYLIIFFLNKGHH